MNIIDDESLKKERDELYNKFVFYSNNLLSAYEACKSKICLWEYSLGIAKEIIPYEGIIPTNMKNNGRILKKITKSNFESKNFIVYGLDNNGKVIFFQRRADKDIEKYGENIRIVDDEYILSTHIYSSNPEKNRLSSICHSYKKGDVICYISIAPPYNWFVRIDKVINDKIVKSSMFATSWFKQIDYDFIYDGTGELSKIVIGDFIHWQRN
ncbi:TPA: hypothetical protein RY449_004179 [Escherichia albertii]|uniref:Uncharacterized protein n=4 Tax=Escherichia albertii TaxID=208962 RepID=A0A7Z8DWT2_ESCAL|nr:hypothetical protein [Escherichia albertii]EFB7458547.1 hypothetical protein [Escherichia albertii]MCB2258728.1 hypothetical protein [Escherichia albertii]MCB2268525.1 hypothetical protein [Escherichia albertii]MCB2270729.1 hypothetical protein [Escherichia albertii]MCU7331501.1 hypothetical protein [Escherichia albertii]